MTDNTQELDVILAAVNLAGVSNGLHRDITDPEEIKHRREGFIKANPACKDAKQAILDWHNKQTLELLDRLENEAKSLVRNPDGTSIGAEYIPLSAIEAERNKLKESSND